MDQYFHKSENQIITATHKSISIGIKWNAYEQYPTTTHSHKQWLLLTSKLFFWTLTVSEYCFTSLSAHWGNIATERSPKWGYALLLFRMTSRVLYSARCHRHHCTLHSFEQFGALCMHNHDNKYPARTGFEPGTCRLQAPVDTNEPSGPASTIRTARGTDKNISSLSVQRYVFFNLSNWIWEKRLFCLFSIYNGKVIIVAAFRNI